MWSLKNGDVSGCHFGAKASVVELGVVNVTVILWEAAVPIGHDRHRGPSTGV